LKSNFRNNNKFSASKDYKIKKMVISYNKNLIYITVKWYDILNFGLNLIIINFNHNGILRQRIIKMKSS